MSFTVLPTSVGGIGLNSITNPLSSLLTRTYIDNLTYPSDLGSNPTMGHAVIIQAFDYTTELSSDLPKIAASVGGAVTGLIDTGKQSAALISEAKFIKAGETLIEGTAKALEPLAPYLQGPKYTPMKKGKPIVTISMFMPETLSVSYDSSYSDISITEELGVAGIVGHAIADISKNGLKNVKTPYEIALGTMAAGSIASKVLGTGQNVGPLAAQALGVVVNPQMQLLYRGVGLRTFQLEFIMTPKSSAEAKVVKDICDSLAYYSLPGTAGAQTGEAGQYLTPPQIFTVQFKFLGQNNVIGNITNVISSALTNSGLGFLTTGTPVTDNSPDAKLFKVNDCVLENVNVDYAPNGFASYNDGYPVQTRLTLQFKETQMLTKKHFDGTAVSFNYNPTPGSFQTK
jgi:hypothetical protein